MIQINSCAAAKITDLCVCSAADQATQLQLKLLQGKKTKNMWEPFHRVLGGDTATPAASKKGQQATV